MPALRLQQPSATLLLHLRLYRAHCARRLILAELLVIGGLLKVLRQAARLLSRG